jgi:transcriptional repressor NrdR
MKCPHCDENHSKVTDSRETDSGIRRRRECLACGHRFTTHELVRIPVLQVDKRDGRREDFSREKLLTGVTMACTRRPIPQRELDRLADDIEADLQRIGSGIVKSRDLGLMVLERLRLLDEVAYVRYASVYYDFQSAADFEEQARSVRLGQPEPMVGLAAVTTRRTRRSSTGRRPRTPWQSSS